jgi:pimeloyl-ACP methyl ester carboxylesterase
METKDFPEWDSLTEIAKQKVERYIQRETELGRKPTDNEVLGIIIHMKELPNQEIKKKKSWMAEKGDHNQQPIIFLHGFPFDHTMWEPIVYTISNEYYCYYYDLKGLGKHHTRDLIPFEGYVDDLFEMMDEEFIKEPILCGLSMGGYVAMRAMAREASRFSGLILFDTRSEGDTEEARNKRNQSVTLIDKEGLEVFIKQFVPNLFSKQTIANKPEVYSKYLNIALKSDPFGVKLAQFAMQGREDSSTELSKWKLPVLVLCGEEDTLTPPASMKTMAEKISNSEFHLIPEAGHMPPVENPELSSNLVLEFLHKHFPKKT